MLLAAALQVAVPGAAGTLPDYDCRARGGDYDKRELEGSEGRVQIDGTISPEDIGGSRNDWLPAAGILFQPDSGKGGIGLQVWRLSRETLAYGVRNIGQGDSPYQLGTLPADQPIRFSVALDSSGRLDIRVNDTAHAFSDAGVGPQNPILMCSGGHFAFRQLTAQGTAPRS